MKMSSQILKIRSGGAQATLVLKIRSSGSIAIPLLFRSGPNRLVLILSEIRVNRAGVEVEISLKMFLLQRQKHFVSQRLFPTLSLLLLIALEVKLTELEKLPLPSSARVFIHGIVVLCIDYGPFVPAL